LIIIYRQTWANGYLRIATTILRSHFDISLHIKLRKTTNCQQRPLFLGPSGGRYTQVWLYCLCCKTIDKKSWKKCVTSFIDGPYLDLSDLVSLSHLRSIFFWRSFLIASRCLRISTSLFEFTPTGRWLFFTTEKEKLNFKPASWWGLTNPGVGRVRPTGQYGHPRSFVQPAEKIFQLHQLVFHVKCNFHKLFFQKCGPILRAQRIFKTARRKKCLPTRALRSVIIVSL